MRRILPFALSLLGTITAVAPAGAQDEDRFGATVTGRVLYDSNIARSDKALAAARGIAPDDVLFSPSVALDLQQRLGGVGAFLRGSIGYDFYKNNTHLNRERLDLGSGLRLRAAPCQATVSGNFARRQSDLLDVSVTTTAQNVEEVKTLGLEADCPRPAGLAPTLSLSKIWSSNSAAELSTSDSQTFTAMAGLGYSQPVLGTLSVFGRYGTTDFMNRIIQVSPGRFIKDGFDIYAGGLRYIRKLGSNIDLELSPSYTSLRPVIATVPGFEGFAYEAQLTYRPTSSLQTHFTFQRAPIPTNRFDVTYSLAQSYILQLDYSLSPRWTIQLGGSHTTNKFQGANLVSGTDLSNETYEAVFGAVRFALTKDLSLSLDSRGEHRDANVLQYNYNSFQVGFSVQAAF